MYDDVCIMQDAPLHMWHAYTTHVAEKCKTHHDDNFRLSSKRMNDKHQYFQCIPFVVFFLLLIYLFASPEQEETQMDFAI